MVPRLTAAFPIGLQAGLFKEAVKAKEDMYEYSLVQQVPISRIRAGNCTTSYVSMEAVAAGAACTPPLVRSWCSNASMATSQRPRGVGLLVLAHAQWPTLALAGLRRLTYPWMICGVTARPSSTRSFSPGMASMS